MTKSKLYDKVQSCGFGKRFFPKLMLYSCVHVKVCHGANLRRRFDTFVRLVHVLLRGRS